MSARGLISAARKNLDERMLKAQSGHVLALMNYAHTKRNWVFV
jgi:hypothetical protein